HYSECRYLFIQSYFVSNDGKIISYQPSCQSNKLTFVAEPGKDYETIAASASAQCGVILQEVHPDGTTTSLIKGD
ncbi:hypothetical protein SASC598J21_002950, partial [Snodgrassella alvi SCGC AB-598-J21]